VPYKTERFNSKSEALRFGIEWFRKNAPKGSVLYEGDSAYCEPHPILVGVPEKTKVKANKLCAKAEERWRAHGVDDKKYLAMYEKWKKIVGLEG
jgi:hypothetical protein